MNALLCFDTFPTKIADDIAITPGLLVITNPEHDNNNDTVYVGTIRTTLTF